MKQKIVIEIDEKLKHALDRFEGSWARDTVCSNALDIAKAIKEGVPLPQNATNGDVIKAMFPDISLGYPSDCDSVLLKKTKDGRTAFGGIDPKWMNAPYKAENEVKE